MSFMALLTAVVFYARSQDSFLPPSVCKAHVVFSTAGFKSGGKPCPKTSGNTGVFAPLSTVEEAF